ncbi:hypothetical protein RHA1_ro01672 [Rhodococcus jostii RHA1]|uniref:Uncharacterized protein n=1 Tax=Rhodococcus jostii (strain RHA1) TaxID=101510 RepID=Q0SG51_RHOJR|nr:hypothetical protein RHA1_ro01672 [Rhodococcus jostii RHA1]
MRIPRVRSIRRNISPSIEKSSSSCLLIESRPSFVRTAKNLIASLRRRVSKIRCHIGALRDVRHQPFLHLLSLPATGHSES